MPTKKKDAPHTKPSQSINRMTVAMNQSPQKTAIPCVLLPLFQGMLQLSKRKSRKKSFPFHLSRLTFLFSSPSGDAEIWRLIYGGGQQNFDPPKGSNLYYFFFDVQSSRFWLLFVLMNQYQKVKQKAIINYVLARQCLPCWTTEEKNNLHRTDRSSIGVDRNGFVDSAFAAAVAAAATAKDCRQECGFI